MRKAVLFAVLALGHHLSAQIDSFPETIEKVKLSIFPVACGSYPDKDNQMSVKEIMGTGFFVDYDGDFITAAHVISEHFKWNKRNEPTSDCFPVIYVPNPTWQVSRWFQFGSCTVNDAIDIAVCKTRLNPFGESGLHINRLHLGSTVPKDGTAVAFTGFPQFILVPITSRANVASSGDFFTPGQMDVVIDKTTWHGVSGGPLYLADGTVIGIVIKTGEGLWSGMGFARQTSSFLKFLSEKKIPIWQEEQKPSTKKEKK
jgi:Trypsin-like peptidase domain